MSDELVTCPIDGCGATQSTESLPMKCRGFGTWDPRCMANWMSCDPENLEPYSGWLAGLEETP